MDREKTDSGRLEETIRVPKVAVHRRRRLRWRHRQRPDSDVSHATGGLVGRERSPAIGFRRTYESRMPPETL